MPRYRIVTKREVPPAVKEEVNEESTTNDCRVNSRNVIPTLKTASTDTKIDKSKMLDGIDHMIGTPYSWAGTNEDGIDCSGFVCKIFREVLGVLLPHSAVEQYQMSSLVPSGQEEFGDLVFFNTNGQSVSHVGIYLGKSFFAHASVSEGVTISSLESSYYKKHYVNTRRCCK
ncbi:MAG TPA: C40 family peptidase [Bacteroidota bacterium]|nr:C40 family peptidase [Bacteroidota bacterium]